MEPIELSRSGAKHISITGGYWFNTSAASCINQEAASAIEFMISKDFDAFQDNCEDGVCEDIDGKEWCQK